MRLRQEADAVSVSVRDEGVGLPVGFDPAKSKGLGMRIVTALAEQLGATVTPHVRGPGAEFVLFVPLEMLSQGRTAARTDDDEG